MGKVFGGIFGTLIIVIVIIFLLLHFGLLSWGNGNGTSDGEINSETIEEENVTVKDEAEEITITLVVSQDKYLIDEQEVTLTQIKEKVTDDSATIKVVLEDNYASKKAWDEIKTSFAKWGITPIEQ